MTDISETFLNILYLYSNSTFGEVCDFDWYQVSIVSANELAPVRRSTWIIDDSIYWRIYVTPCPNESTIVDTKTS